MSGDSVANTVSHTYVILFIRLCVSFLLPVDPKLKRNQIKMSKHNAFELRFI